MLWWLLINPYKIGLDRIWAEKYLICQQALHLREKYTWKVHVWEANERRRLLAPIWRWTGSLLASEHILSSSPRVSQAIPWFHNTNLVFVTSSLFFYITRTYSRMHHLIISYHDLINYPISIEHNERLIILQNLFQHSNIHFIYFCCWYNKTAKVGRLAE